jgi:5'-phosphate synthase pdxT subunit
MLLISPRPLPLFSFHLAESTTIALLAKLSGLLDPLREFSKTKPVWGSCAGAILMSRNVTNTKKGGQDLLGGLSVTTARNGWGSQVGRPWFSSFTIHY